MSKLLTIEPVPGFTRARRVVVDCRHGTTTVHFFEGRNGPIPTDAELAATALARHYAEERCRCTRKLRRQYGLPIGHG
jgi:hypothetical protein